MAEAKGRVFSQFNKGNNILGGFTQTESGLLMPDTSVTPKDMKDVITDVMKASPEEQKAFEKRLDKKLGTLMSAYYSLFTTTVSNYGAAGKPRYTPQMTLLRQTFRQSLIDGLIVNAREQQVKMVSKRVLAPKLEKGWQVKHVRHADPYFRPTPDIEKRIAEVESVIENPWTEVHPNFRDVLVKMVRGELIVDRKVMIIDRTLQGKPLRWWMLPPDDIKPRFEVLYKMMMKYGLTTFHQAIEKFRTAEGIDLTDIAFVQELDDLKISGAWRKDEIEVDITNPNDEINQLGYGISMFEKSLEATALLLYAWHYNKQNFLTNYPEAFLIINGEIDTVGLESFKSQIYKDIGPQGNQRLPVLPLNEPEFKAQLLRLRDTMNDMQFIQLIRLAVALKCAAYRMHPSTINLAPDMGERGPILDREPDQATIIGEMQEEGFKGLLQSLSDYITRAIIKPWYPDLIFTWSVEDVPPEQDRVALYTQKTSMGMTADEWRAAEGLPPLEEVTDGAYSGQVPLSPFLLQDKEMRQQQEMMEQMMEQQAERGGAEGFGGGAKAKSTAGTRPKPKPAASAKKKPAAKKKKTTTKKSWGGIMDYLRR